MFHKKSESNTYGVIGLGRFGRALATELAIADADLLVIDSDEEKVRAFREYTENAFAVKNFDRESLEKTGIGNCDVAVVCIGEEMDTSILAVLRLVSMGVKKVIAKASSAEHGEILEKLGAEVVYPERDMAIRLAHRLETARMLDFVQLSEKLNISKLLVPDALVGETVIKADLRRKYGVNIIAIEQSGKLIETIDPQRAFEKGDILFLAGTKGGLNRLSDWAKKSE